MTRVILIRATIAAILALASSYRSSMAQQASALPETPIRLTVAAALAPEPALRYQLLPELEGDQSGQSDRGIFEVSSGAVPVRV